MSYISPARQKRKHVVLAAGGGVLAVGVAAAILFSPWAAGASAPGLFADAPNTTDTGVLPEGATVFDNNHLGISGLESNLASALQAATTDAAADGIRISVTSGWRSPAYQDQLLVDAITQYGSEEEAHRWVATSTTSPHVSGDAVDIGGYDAMDWLHENGSRYDLCRIYDNEAWHFELRVGANSQGCPPMYFDPTFDPRMQR